MRKIEVHTDKPTEFELGDTAADKHRSRKEERGHKGRRRHRNNRGRRGREARREDTAHSAEDRVAEKPARTARSDTEMDTQGGGESHFNHYPGIRRGI